MVVTYRPKRLEKKRVDVTLKISWSVLNDTDIILQRRTRSDN